MDVIAPCGLVRCWWYVAMLMAVGWKMTVAHLGFLSLWAKVVVNSEVSLKVTLLAGLRGSIQNL